VHGRLAGALDASRQVTLPPRATRVPIGTGFGLADPIGLATPEDAPTALAYKGDRIAASFPNLGCIFDDEAG